MNSVAQQKSPYLREQRQFPNIEIRELSKEVDLAYIDIANKVNSRIIGIFPVNNQVVNGEAWFLTGQPNRQQALRQVYTFIAAGAIPHGINLATITYFSRIYGSFTDGTLWYPLPYVDVVNVTNQVGVTIDATNININAGATAPTITKGIIILEWISQF